MAMYLLDVWAWALAPLGIGSLWLFNADTGWTPGGYLRDRGIGALDMLVITNFDEDHTRGYPSFAANGIGVGALLRNKSITAADITRMKDPDGGPGPGVAGLIRAIGGNFTGGAYTPVAPGFNYEVAYAEPAAVGLESNSLSLMMLARCNGCNVLFTGDLDKAGWNALGERARTLPHQTHIMIAPHHGRDDGQWDGFAGNVPLLRWVVISDKGHMYDTQKLACPFYGALAQGWKFGPNLEWDRKVLTTRSDGSIAIQVDAQGNVRGWTFDESYAAMRGGGGAQRERTRSVAEIESPHRFGLITFVETDCASRAQTLHWARRSRRFRRTHQRRGRRKSHARGSPAGYSRSTLTPSRGGCRRSPQHTPRTG
jgi:hypothetical protein